MRDLTFKIISHRDREEAIAMLGKFLETDEYYLDSAKAYEIGRERPYEAAVDLFLQFPRSGEIVLAVSGGDAAGCCVLTYVISTSAGDWVAKLDDVFIDERFRGRGMGTAMMMFVEEHARRRGARRIDTSVHSKNYGAARFYQRLGYLPLNEERVSKVIAGVETSDE